MNSVRTWHDLEIYSPRIHRRFFWSWKEKTLANYPWYSFFWEPYNYSGSYGQVVLYLTLR